MLVPGERGSGDADVADSDSVRVLMQCPNNRQNLHLVVKMVRMVLCSHTHTHMWVNHAAVYLVFRGEKVGFEGRFTHLHPHTPTHRGWGGKERMS